MKSLVTLFFSLIATLCLGQMPARLQSKLEAELKLIEPKVISWREHLHQFPELSNREFKTAAYIAEHLKKLGLEVRTGVAHTGIVAVLNSGKPGPVLALRADMDALPVTERNRLSYASKEVAIFNGKETGVMHACGHDAHVAILMGVAEILVKHKAELVGTVKFIFQPAEEGAPEGEEGGASLMIKEGVLQNPKPDAIVGLHVQGHKKLGVIRYKSGGFMASSDWFFVKVTGKQAHGAFPWLGIDPIVTSASIIQGLQTIVSRQMDISNEPAVITVGRINAGIRENIIPETAEFSGTIRTLDRDMQKQIHQKISQVTENIAVSAGAKAEVRIVNKTPVTYNDPTLTQKLVPSMEKALGKAQVELIKADMGAEDFGFYGLEIPAFFYFIGGCPPEIDLSKAAPHHTPDFLLDNQVLLPGMKSMTFITVDFLFSGYKAKP